MIGVFNLNHYFCCWHLILCIQDVDTSGICIKKFDVLKLFFDKMTAFLTSDFWHFDMSLIIGCYHAGVSNKHCSLSLFSFV